MHIELEDYFEMAGINLVNLLGMALIISGDGDPGSVFYKPEALHSERTSLVRSFGIEKYNQSGEVLDTSKRERLDS